MKDYKSSLARGEAQRFLKDVTKLAVSDAVNNTNKATELINSYFAFSDKENKSFSAVVTEIVNKIEAFVLKLLAHNVLGTIFPAYGIGNLFYMAYRTQKCPYEIEERIGSLPIEKFGGLRIGDVDDRGIVNFEDNPEGWCKANHNKNKTICKRLAAGMTVTLKNGKKIKGWNNS